ncbi:fibrocystin-L-like [Oratosquilla oratoria]|uniref:fibrocystin-L-like n=1 Tax=Oratosquilla oratoria TaxID=337810 RepID=UPI003F75CC94
MRKFISVLAQPRESGYGHYDIDGRGHYDGAAKGIPNVTSISPYWMGEGGGVTLTLKGTDFSEDQFNQFDPKLGNKVILVNEADSIECDVVQYLTNKEKIICVSRKRTMKDGPRVYSVKVFVDGLEALGDYTVEYADWVSPMPHGGVLPIVGTPGGLVTVKGRWHTDRYIRLNTSDPWASNSRTPAIRSIFMGGKKCDPFDPDTNEFYEPLTSSRVVCRVTSTAIGPMNFTIVVDNYGTSVTPSGVLKINSKNILYMYHTYVEITSVSPRVSNVAGGALVTIEGNSFDPTPGKTRVTIGGAECVITEIDDYSIKCLAPPQADTGPSSGGQGVLYETWEGEYFDDLSDQTAWEALTSLHPAYNASVKNSTAFVHPLSGNSSARLRGFLHLPYNGNFTLGIYLNGSARLYLGLDGTKDTLVEQQFWQQFVSNQSNDIYVEIRTHGEFLSNFELVLLDYNTTRNRKDTPMANDEMQRFHVHPRKYDEIQRISVSGDPGNQRFDINGYESDDVDMTHPGAVRTALLDLVSFQCRVQGPSPSYGLQTDYEESDESLRGQRGEVVKYIDPFCGRRSLKLYQYYATPYDNSRDPLVNLRTHPHACFAIQGLLKPTLEVRYKWKENNRYHHSSFNFEHEIDSVENSWTYTCLDLLAWAETTWMTDRWSPSAPLYLLKIRLFPKSSRTPVFIDSFSITNDPITVVQTRPSAFLSNGILLQDIKVEQIEGSTDLDVTFLTENCMNGYPLLQAASAAGSENVNITRIQAASGVPGGTWSMVIEGKNISGLRPNITEFELQDEIEAALGVSGMVVRRRNQCFNHYWDVEWLTSPGNKEPSTIDTSQIIHDGPSLYSRVQLVRDGHAAHRPISTDFFTQFSEEPQVVVSVNDYTAVCSADCDFAYDDSTAATLTSVSATVGEDGEHTFTITGSGFDSSSLSDYMVFVGDNSCSVSAASSTTITCAIPHLSAGTYSVRVLVQPRGEATPRLSHTVALAVTSVSPATGGTGGGYTVTVSGTGFPVDLEGWEDNTVSLGDAECVIKEADAGSVTCIAPPLSADVVDVTVSVGGESASLPSSFTYDDALSATVTGVTPETSFVLGGSEAVLTGTNFGDGSSGSVKIGSALCNVTSWTATEIRCTLPPNPAGPHEVKVNTGDSTARGTFSINYILRITASSPLSGSLNGGTKMIIEGEGFGTNCSLLEVKLGSSMKCDVKECTDTRITCVTGPLRKKHVVSNLGQHQVYGEGFAWYPRRLSIQEGDSVTWNWRNKNNFSQVFYSVFSTSSAVSYEYDGKGFNSGPPSIAGSLTVTFTKAGDYSYASNIVIEEHSMSGIIEVKRSVEEALDVQVFVGEFAASVEHDGSNPVIPSDSCTLLDSGIDGCNSSAPETAPMFFVKDLCMTPTVTNVSASATETINGLGGIIVRAGTELTLSGSGFGDQTCQTVVSVGEALCAVSASSETSITCTLDSQDGLVSLQPQDLVVNVVNRGTATIDVPDYESQGRISIAPVITSFSPTQGSLAGGTLITITGSGLVSADGVARVMLGSSPCNVLNVSDSEITCVSSPATEGDVNLVVAISAFLIPPISELSSQIFTYSSSATPTVTDINASGSTITISGASFGSSESAVKVTLVMDASRKKRSSEVEGLESRKIEEPVSESHKTVHQKDVIAEDMDAEGPRSLHKPKIRTGLFDDLRKKNSFWGDFTGTFASSFLDTVAQGVWRQGGSKPRDMVTLQDDVITPSRRVRETSEPVTYTCVVSSVTDSAVVCDVSEIPAGSYGIRVNVEGSGDASITSGGESIVLSPTVTAISPVEGSIHGGTRLTITGSGFDLDATVTVGENICVVVNIEPNTITCMTQANAAGTVSVVVTSGGTTSTGLDFTYSLDRTPQIDSVSPNTDILAEDTLTLSGSGLDGIEVFIDDVTCSTTSSSDTSVTCSAPELTGGSHNVVGRDNTYGDSNAVAVTYAITVDDISPNTGGSGGVEATISGKGFDLDGTLNATICDVPCEVIRGSYSSITCIVPATTLEGSTTQVCDLVVTLADGTTTTLSNAFTYDDSLTPRVSSISPTRGGTAGGTRLTITGTGFAPSGNVVSIGGSACVVKSENEAEIVCVTEDHSGPGTFPVHVEVPDKGIALTDTSDDFFYIDRWSSKYTWGGKPPPIKGEYVHIDEGQTILIDKSTPVLKMLLITGGHVIFDREASEELILRSEYILILGGGSLSIGSEEEPFLGEAVIELHGTPRSIELPMYGAKVLAVRNGTLDLHGKPIEVTWTHLATTAAAGSSVIELKQPVTWSAGDQIVIATTEHRFFKNENEERTVASVSDDGLQVTLTEPLEFEHISIEQTLGGRTIETRAEVGLLTRNVKVRGSINTDFVEDIPECGFDWHPDQFEVQSCFNGKFGDDTTSSQFGATVMIFGKYPDQDLVAGRISYVEVTEAGQAFQLGRYPLHFHLVGNVNTSYIRGCAVHRTYNRAVTIHAANYLTVERNVVYNNMGHAIFTEDGVEQFNIIQYNLAIFTRTSSSLLNVDVTPSSYWVVNPNNIVRHNAAAGGTHFGYWYRLERHPSGPSATTSYCPNSAPMGEFTNNTAHSMGRYGLWVFSMDGYYPRTGPCWGSGLVAKWHNFTVWKTDRGAEVVIGGALQFHNFVTLDNENAGVEMVEVKGNFGSEGPGLFNSHIVGYSALSPEGCGAGSGVITPKKTIFSMSNVTFVNFDNGSCAAISGCSQCKPFNGGYRVLSEGLNFINADQKIKFKWEHETIHIDADGSLSGTPENVIVPHMGLLPPSSCTFNVTEFSVNPEAPGSVCSAPIKFHRVAIDGRSIRPTSLQGIDLVLRNEYGESRTPFRKKRITFEGWMGLVFSGENFKISLEGAEQITNISYTAKYSFLDPGDYVLMTHPLMQSPDGFSTLRGVNQTALSALPNASSFHGDFYFDNSTKEMTYIAKRERRPTRSVLFEGRRTGDTRDINFEVYRCQFDGCVPPTPPSIPLERPDQTFQWSDTETWKEVPVGSGGHPDEDTYGLPVEGDDIIIPPGMWLVVDTETPPLGKVFVYGGLEFDNTMDHVFEATHIFVQDGSVVAGFTEADPFTYNLRVVLRGTLDSTDSDNEDMPLPNGGLNVGWKAIGVFGHFLFHGVDVGSTWVKLGATAEIGDKEVTLAESVSSDWIGKQVMLTPTGRGVQSEIRTVTAVSSDGLQLTLDVALNDQHLGETYTSGGTTYAMAGEVGLLTRNIVIEGKDYPDLTVDSFGGRVLVSTFSNEGLTYKGTGQFSNVEFRNMGQEDWIDASDPRYALAFHGLEDTSDSYVKKCSFNKNFNSAIGLFAVDGLVVEDNVIYHTVGSSVVIEGTANVLRRNLIATMLFPGAYNGKNDKENPNWYGGVYMLKAVQPVFEDNVIAGTEQAAVRTYGEDCAATSTWENNEAHSVMYGVMTWKQRISDGDLSCAMVQNIYVWRAFETSFFFQTGSSVLLANVKSVDSKIGTNQLIYSPPALSHEFSNKTSTIRDSFFVGASPSHSCEYHNLRSDIEAFFSKQTWGNKGKDGGNTGILIPAFPSGHNMAPKHAFHEVSSYPALRGTSYIENVQFSGFMNAACGSHVAISTNLDAEDATHPVFVSQLSFSDTPSSNKVFMHRPQVNSVNPSDCVDMDCDGLKKVLITDEDGSLYIGTSGSSLTSMAEFEWDGDSRRGVGDYRIPVSLRMHKNGSRIDAEKKFPNKGIIRDNSCTLVDNWRAWQCNLETGKHRMMIIESMDSDTEIRRLSPIALIANPGTNGYVDLLNGPMDRGWCKGYTCQERISTFYSIVSTSTLYEMAFTSTPPQVLRFHLLHADPSESVLLRIFLPKTQRFDVYVDDEFVPPTNIDNSQYPGSYQLLPEDPNDPEKFFPTLSDVGGSNYLQREEKYLHVVLRGGQLTVIKTMPTIILSFGLVVDEDNFFEENARDNIAYLLGINPANIRVTNIIREDSRRRRSTESVQQVEVEIAKGPSSSTNESASETVTEGDDLSYDDLLDVGTKVVNCFQTNTCPDTNLTIAKLEVLDPIPPPAEPGPRLSEEEASEIVEDGELFSDKQQQQELEALNETQKSVEYAKPGRSELANVMSSVGEIYVPFQDPPQVHILDTDGEVLKGVGHSSDPWLLQVTLSGGDPQAVLVGNSTAPFIDGVASFDDLSVSKIGSGYTLNFSIVYPDIAPRLPLSLGYEFRMTEPQLDVGFTQFPKVLAAGTTFSIGVSVISRATQQIIDSTMLEDYSLDAKISKCGGGALSGPKSVTVNGSEAELFNFNDLRFQKMGVVFFSVKIDSNPSGYRMCRKHDAPMTILSSSFVMPEETSTFVLEMEVKASEKDIDKWEPQIAEALLNTFMKLLQTDTWYNSVSFDKIEEDTFKVTVEVEGSDASLDDFKSTLCARVDRNSFYHKFKRKTYIYKKPLADGYAMCVLI